jgi:hypothetical protein
MNRGRFSPAADVHVNEPKGGIFSARARNERIFCRLLPGLRRFFASATIDSLQCVFVHHATELPMTEAERQIMRHFRQYHVRANEMLFFNTNPANAASPKFQSAMESLIRNGLVVRERRRNAYSLTDAGFTRSMSA